MITDNKLQYFSEHLECGKPITADIFLTNFCNNKCSYCRYSNTSGDQMSFELFEKIYSRLKEFGVKGFILTGGGEPTLAKDFEKICKFLEERNEPYGVNSNLAKTAFKIKPTYLKVSIDGYDSQSYKEIRGVNLFDKVVENVKEYIDWKNTNSKETRVGVQCIPTSVEHAIKFYEFAKKFNADYIQFRPIEQSNWSFEQLKNTKLLHTELKKEFKDKADVYLSYKFNHIKRMYEKNCPAHWSVINVNWNGMVYYCCHKPTDVIGSIFEENILQKIFTSIPKTKCEFPCRLTGANLFLENNNISRYDDKYFI